MKWYSYILCFVLILVGIWSGITLWQKMNAESYIHGSINVTNDLYLESFIYDNSLYSQIIAFNDDNLGDDNNFDTHNYSWSSKNLPTVSDFNGIAKVYQVEINGYRIFDATINAGGVLARINIDFYGPENNLLCKGYYDLSIRFLSNRTEISVKTVGKQNADFVEQYFDDNGLRITIKENKNV